LARIYVNIEALLQESRGLSKQVEKWDITNFAQGFTQRQPFFDFINIENEHSISRKLEGKPNYIYFRPMLLKSINSLRQRSSSCSSTTSNVNILFTAAGTTKTL